MAMRETPGSLRAYFILVGLLVTLSAGANLLTPGVDMITMALSVMNVGLGVGLVVVGALAVKLLQSAPLVLHLAVWANYGWFLLLYGLTLIAGAATSGLHFQALIGAAVAAYLSVNVARLSKAGA
jgi:hypothetical protein